MTDLTALPVRQNALARDPDTFDAILGLVAEGKHSLFDIAKMLAVPRREVQSWIIENEDNLARYNRAVEVGNQARRERIIAELESVAFLDVQDCFNRDGMILPINKMPEHVRKAIQKFDEYQLRAAQRGVTVKQKIEFYDRLKALEMLGKSLKMFTDKTEVEIKGNPYAAVPVKVTERLVDPDTIEGEYTRE